MQKPVSLRESCNNSAARGLAAKLDVFDATMIVMGGVIGSGIFITPYVVAQAVHTPALILAEWVIGGAVSLAGAFVFAELASRRPKVGGDYAYLQEGVSPLAGFLYGWMALLVINAGGTAAVALTFAQYVKQIGALPVSDRVIGSATILVLMAINCAGVRAGSNVQSVLMILRIAAVLLLAGAGIWWAFAGTTPMQWRPVLDRPPGGGLAAAMALGLIPVLFSYGGYQSATFLAAEIREPRKSLPRALLLGVAGVTALYVLATFACVAVLGGNGLAATATPASAVMQRVLGRTGARLIAAGITLSALGFLSQSVLTYPRVFFAMAKDGLFPAGIARVNPRTQTPVAAIVLQCTLTIVVICAGHFESILNYVESMDAFFLGLAAATLFAFRRRDAGTARQESAARVPGHPWTTLGYVTICWIVAANSLYKYRMNAMLVLAILGAGVPFYLYWRSQRPRSETAEMTYEHPEN